jgi:uncharacterized membrane protein (DUF2068 family)
MSRTTTTPNAPTCQPQTLSPVGLWVIGTYKLAKAVLLIAAGVAVYRLRHEDVAGGVLRLAARLRLDPDNHYIHAAVAKLSGLDERHLEAIGAGVVLYGLLYVAQGVGLLLQRRWGEYLVVVTTGFLIPLEVYEVVRRFGPVRVAVLLLNAGIVLYLVDRLRRETRIRAGVRGGTGPPPDMLGLDHPRPPTGQAQGSWR